MKLVLKIEVTDVPWMFLLLQERKLQERKCMSCVDPITQGGRVRYQKYPRL